MSAVGPMKRVEGVLSPSRRYLARQSADVPRTLGGVVRDLSPGCRLRAGAGTAAPGTAGFRARPAQGHRNTNDPTVCQRSRVRRRARFHGRSRSPGHSQRRPASTCEAGSADDPPGSADAGDPRCHGARPAIGGHAEDQRRITAGDGALTRGWLTEWDGPGPWSLESWFPVSSGAGHSRSRRLVINAAAADSAHDRAPRRRSGSGPKAEHAPIGARRLRAAPNGHVQPARPRARLGCSRRFVDRSRGSTTGAPADARLAGPLLPTAAGRVTS